jgi:hypothetical protein
MNAGRFPAYDRYASTPLPIIPVPIHSCQ